MVFGELMCTHTLFFFIKPKNRTNSQGVDRGDVPAENEEKINE